MRAHLIIQQNLPFIYVQDVSGTRKTIKKKAVSGIMEQTIQLEEKGTKQKGLKQLFHCKVQSAMEACPRPHLGYAGRLKVHSG